MIYWTLRQLGSKDPEKRKRAAEQLGKSGDARTTLPLIHTLTDSHPEVREKAAEALVRIGTIAIEPLVAAVKSSNSNLCEEAAKALAKFGLAAVKPLIAALNDSNPDARDRAAARLEEICDVQAVGLLIPVLRDRDNYARAKAATLLGKLGDIQAVEPLVHALEDLDYGVRVSAARFDGERDRFKARRELDYGVRASAARALGNLGDVRAVEPLIAVLRDNDPNKRARSQHGESLCLMRIAAAQALGKLRDERAVEPLLAVLKEEGGWVRNCHRSFVFPADRQKKQSARVRNAAAEALAEIGDVRAVEPLLYVAGALTDDFERKEVIGVLAKFGVSVIELLFAALKNSDGQVGGPAAEAICKIGNLQAVEPLIDVLKDKDDGARGRAAWALGSIGDARAVEPLISLLKDKDDGVRRSAARALSIGDARAVEPLIDLLKDKDVGVREAAASALESIGDARAVEPLIDLLKDKDDGARRRAALALGSIGDARAIETLIATLKDRGVWGGPGNEAEGNVAAQALVRFGTLAVEPLTAALKDNDYNVRALAAKALGMIGDHGAVAPLITALKDYTDNLDWIKRQRSTMSYGSYGGALRHRPSYLYFAWIGVDALLSLVQSNVHCISSDCLCNLTRLSVLEMSTREDEFGETYHPIVKVDCSQIVLLARQELKGRGLEA